MAVSAIISVAGDTASPAVAALLNEVAPERLHASVGEAAVILFQNHFRNAPTNKRGWESTGFWASAAKATNWKTSSVGVVINVNQVGVRQRLIGGTIRPTGSRKYLSLPAREAAYGRAPAEFDNLVLAFRNRAGKPEAFALVEAKATQITWSAKSKKTGQRKQLTRQSVGGAVMFWLVKEVTQTADPSVIPDERDITQEAREVLERIARRAGYGGAA